MHSAAHSWGQMETTCVLLPSRTHSSLWVSLKGEWCSCRRSVWRVMRPQGRHFLQGIFFFKLKLKVFPFIMFLKRALDSWWLALTGVVVLKHRYLCKMTQRERIAPAGKTAKGDGRELLWAILIVCTYKTACHLLQNIAERLCPKRSTSIPSWSARRGVLQTHAIYPETGHPSSSYLQMH